MFLHLVPKILHPMGNLCTLDSVSVPELSLRLTGNDLVAMRPYQAGASFIDIPGNVRYALEMAAFSKAVTPDAVSYEDNKNALVRQYSNLGKSSFFAGGILALIGLLILSCVRRLNQRVKFLNSFAYK